MWFKKRVDKVSEAKQEPKIDKVEEVLKATNKDDFVGTEPGAVSSNDFLEIEKRFMSSQVNESTLEKMVNNTLSVSEKKKLIKSRLDDDEFKIFLSVYKFPNQDEIIKHRMSFQMFVFFLNKDKKNVEKAITEIDNMYETQMRDMINANPRNK